MSNVAGYSLSSYGDMSRAGPRISAYIAALRRAVTPGCTVIDLGAGPGLFSLLACQFGAGHVWAIEPDPSLVLARELARDNGYDDRITFFRGLSTEFTPPAPVDVLISDIRGALPLFQHHIATIADARRRLLRPGGVQLPQGDVIRIALAGAAGEYERLTAPWSADFHGLDLRRGLPFVTNTMTRPGLDPDDLLSPPQDAIRLDYRTITAPDARAHAVLRAGRSGRAHGLAIWFDAQIDDISGYSNAPGEPPLVYGHSFLPFPAPLDLVADDEVEVDLRADLVGDDYEWSWSGRHCPASGGAASSFRQSSMRGRLLDPARLAPRAAQFCPEPGEDLQIARFVLERIDGKTSNAAIAADLLAAFPARFPAQAAALDHVAGIVARFAPAKDRPLSAFP